MWSQIQLLNLTSFYFVYLCFNPSSRSLQTLKIRHCSACEDMCLHTWGNKSKVFIKMMRPNTINFFEMLNNTQWDCIDSLIWQVILAGNKFHDSECRVKGIIKCTKSVGMNYNKHLITMWIGWLRCTIFIRSFSTLTFSSLPF